MSSVSTDRRLGVNASKAIKVACRVATTVPITLSGLQTVDGVALAALDRVLVKDQADTTTNGIYDADTGAWTRSVDFDGNVDAAKGTLIFLTSGTQASSFWQLTSADPIVIGTSALTFSNTVAPGGGGNVTNVGTPTNLQIAQWTTATSIKGLATTGTDSVVLATSPTIVSPTLTTPALGVATATSINKVSIPAPTTAASLSAGRTTE